MNWDIKDLLIQGIGLIAFSVSLIGLLSTNDKKLKTMMTAGTCIFILQFAMLGAWMVVFTLIINVIRTYWSIYRRGWHIALLVSVVQIAIAIPFFIWSIGLFPLVGSIISTFGLFCTSGIRLRLVFIVSGLFWLGNSIAWRSLGAGMSDILFLGAHIYAIFKIRALQKK